ncbi:potassium transporter TrkG [Eilatimonas milleporae]|uniref:Trk system potassium uptake protein TrkH n=1 Tax=Eilatimonas milleporae TaxID=911205 RepID=A0A3M0CJ17_9PROT|nr:potassium transporter TrkG [Eilatimonas milleporae]RMB08767.1 trk system potassium uptake protein TrkH [Eilatimonas milleporae]
MWQARLFYLLGIWILGMAALEAAPLLLALYLGEEQAQGAFLAGVSLSVLTGGALFLGFRGARPVRLPVLTLVMPVVGVTVLSLQAAAPFFFMRPTLGLMPALFDGFSMLTTNGVTAYEGMEIFSAPEMLWRALVAWSGGLAAIVLSLSLLTAMNSGGLQLHRSPLPFGDSREGYDRLRSTSMTLFPLYCLVTVVAWLALLITGLPFFDALILALASVSTTGMAADGGHVLPGGAAAFVVMVTVLISAGNWDFLMTRLQSGRWLIGRDPEARSLVIVFALGLTAVAVSLPPGTLSDIGDIVILTVSAMTTTGFIPADMTIRENLPLAIVILVLASFGGAVASTTGGVRHLRLIMLWLQGRRELERLGHPHGVTALRYGSARAETKDMHAVWQLIASFILMLAAGSLLLAIMGLHFRDALAMSFAMLSLSGPLVALLDPLFAGFAGLRDAEYGILILLMIAGRVETAVFFAFLLRSLGRYRY